uniref:Ribosomal protein S6 kinase delta-1-like n=1 Tax=Phallusia mammillata TaxID=59560 RepID=A0A6F9DRN0_9ASCI|nr:ribosomal protein S6 kinase delta-1-like [Phallusia mammillata]
MYTNVKSGKCNKKYEIVETRQHENGFTLYKIVVKEFVSTGPLEYIKESVIWKRYNDFKSLHQQLFRIHREIYLPGKFPLFVKPKIFGRFDSAVIKERVKCSQDLLDFATEHLALYSSRWFEEFFKHSKPLERSSELGQLKEAPLQPQANSSKVVGQSQTQDSRNRSLSDADLQLFDPCLSSATDTSDEAARNDWLAIVQSSAKSGAEPEAEDPNICGNKSEKQSEISTEGSSLSETSKSTLDISESDNLDDLQLNLSDDELSDLNSATPNNLKSPQQSDVSRTSVSCDASLPEITSQTSSVGLSERVQPNYDAFKEFVESEQKSSTDIDCNAQDKPDKMNWSVGSGVAKEEHRKSSKARAYLQQILDHKNGNNQLIDNRTHDDSTVNITSPIKNMKASKSSKDLRELKSQRGNINFNNANDASRRMSEPNNEVKGSLHDLKKFFLDDNGDELRGLYLVDAAKYISKAQNAESTEMYEDAVLNYKSAISVLLQGVQDDTDEMRIQAVRRKTSKYLKKVEEIHEKFLKNMVNNTSLWTADQTPPRQQFDENEESRDRSSSNERQDAAALEYNRISRLKDGKNRVSSPRHTSKDLIGYKVLGIVGKVLLVLDTLTNHTYVIKVLQKSSMKRRRLRKAVIPTNVPYMVQLHRYYSTENFIYLILEHAAGGRLWEQLSAFVTPVVTNKNKAKSETKMTTKQILETGTTDVFSQANILENKDNQDFIKSKPIETIQSSPPKNSTNFVPGTPKLKNSWSFLENDVKLDTEETSNSQTTQNTEEVSTTSQSHMFTIDSVSTLSDEDGDFTKEPTGESPSSTDSNKDNIECFEPELLSEQDLLTLCNTDSPNRTPTPLGLPVDLSPATERLTISDHSPTVSLHSSTDFDELVTDETANSEQNPIVVNRIVNEHGISTASPTLHFRSRTKSTMSVSDDVNTLSNDADGDVERLPTDECDKKNGENKDTNATFTLFRKMNNAASKIYRIPEKGIKQWGAELIIAIGTLHSVGILCRNLTPENILLTADGHIRLTYFSKWKQVEARSISGDVNYSYCAPEMANVACKKTEACDWWSLGALLYELLIGKPLDDVYPTGISSHTILKYPNFLSEEAKSLLDGLLAYHPTQRLGYGIKGLDDLMSHCFFQDIDWDQLVEGSGCR